MSSKEMKFDENDVVSSENHNLRISMENLMLRDDCQSEQHVRGSHQVSLRGQNSQLVDGQSDQAKDVLKQLEICAAHPEEAGSMDKRHRKITDKGREYRKGILYMELMYISLIISFRSNLTHLHGFQQLVQLP